jgi:hypothetical protein
MDGWKIIHEHKLHILYLVPILGAYFSFNFPKVRIILLLKISAPLYLVSFTGIKTMIPFFYQICLLTALSCLLALLYKKVRNSTYIIRITGLSMLILMPVLYFSIFYSAFSSSESAIQYQRKWPYCVTQYCSSGFSGRSATTYTLSIDPLWGLVYKEIEAISINPYLVEKNCLLQFTEANIVFDQCTEEIVP